MTTRAPATTKFFTNKIQSTEPNFPDYLIEVAEVFSRFDGLPYDRSSIVHEFESLTNRGPYITRDPSDFRDEYSAYGTYLGIFYVERQNGGWGTRLTRAARHLLCSTEPDPGAFCRVQLALFQYPSGLGVTYASNGRPTRVQANAFQDTVSDVQRGVRLVPLRVILRSFLTLVDQGQDPSNIRFSFRTIFHLFNNRIFYEDSRPSTEDIAEAVRAASRTGTAPGLNLGLFKRNFHIMEHTGLLRRTQDRNALVLDLGPTAESANATLRMCRTIATLRDFYDELNRCASATNVEECVRDEILSLSWGRYYDGGNLPGGVLAVLAPETILAPDTAMPPPITRVTPAFPDLEEYNPTASRPRPAPLVGSGAPVDPEQTRILREKANRAHARIVQLLASRVRAQGARPQENIYIDLFVPEADLIIEVKSCNQANLLSQVRRGVSQLYEYRYRLGNPILHLCLALEEEPTGANGWLTDYLLHDRQIYPLWITGHVTLDGPPEAQIALPILFP